MLNLTIALSSIVRCRQRMGRTRWSDRSVGRFTLPVPGPSLYMSNRFASDLSGVVMVRKTLGGYALSSRLHTRLQMAACLALALAVAACGKKDEAAPAPGAAAPGAAAPAATTAAPAVKLSVNELLQRAKTAEKEQRMVAPANDNAMDYYLQIIAQEPSNAQATQALVDLFPMAASSAESAIAQQNVAEAERIIGMLDKSSPGSYTVTTLRAKLDTQRAAGERAEADKLAAETRRLELLAQQQAAAAQAAQAPATPAPSSPAPSATPPPAVAEVPPPATPTQTSPASSTAATPEPASGAPATTPPPAPATGGQSREVRLVRQVPPAFPPEAVRKRQSGWVEVRITVSPQGAVTNAEVVRAQPSRVFDRAALDAVRQWRFEPALRNGQPIAAQRTQRIEFKL